ELDDCLYHMPLFYSTNLPYPRQIYSLSLHDALPISLSEVFPAIERAGLLVCDVEILRLHYAETLKAWRERFMARLEEAVQLYDRSEEHTSELQSRVDIVCRLLLEKKDCSARNIAVSLQLSPADRSLNVMPLFHIQGIMAGLQAPLAAGGSEIITQAVKSFYLHR